MTDTNTDHSFQQDKPLCWTMRVIGLILAGTAAFLLTRDLGMGMVGTVVLVAFSVLGVLTVVSSLWRSHHARTEKSLTLQPQTAPARPEAS